MRNLFFLTLFLTSVISFNSFAQESKKVYAYLFAHMTKSDYGGLYYSTSTDGLHWELLNDGKRVSGDYRGHPDICSDEKGSYFQLGVEAVTNNIIIWKSVDLLEWAKVGEVPKKIFEDTPGHRSNPGWWGAPKMFYDKTSQQYLISWHAPAEGVKRNDFADYWGSMRTFYTLTPDFISFQQAQKLLSYDLATIDVIVRKETNLYYAIIKDEKEASELWPTGKSVRVCVSKKLEGPYSYPSESISPNYREAPTIIPKPDSSGWYMYCEQYPGIQYHLSEAPSLMGPWFDVYTMKYSLPKEARHGCMIVLNKDEYDRIIDAFK